MQEKRSASAEGGYIFVSHSFKYSHYVRIIRNRLEENGMEPICFYLRCLTDENEIVNLIKREIDAREWFLLVDSENARRSRWVQTELEYIRKKNPDKQITVSLEDKENIYAILDKLSNCMRVFLSYSYADRDIADRIIAACVKRDLKVFSEVNLANGEDFTAQMKLSLDDATRKGCVVVIISPSSIHSQTVRTEMLYALAKNANILPVLVDNVSLSDCFDGAFQSVNVCRIHRPIKRKEIESIVDAIDKFLLKRLHGEEYLSRKLHT